MLVVNFLDGLYKPLRGIIIGTGLSSASIWMLVNSSKAWILFLMGLEHILEAHQVNYGAIAFQLKFLAETVTISYKMAWKNCGEDLQVVFSFAST